MVSRGAGDGLTSPENKQSIESGSTTRIPRKNYRVDETTEPQEPSPSTERTLPRRGRSAAYKLTSAHAVVEELQRRQASVAQQARALVEELNQQYVPTTAAVKEIVETRARIGQLAADAIGPSVVGIVTRSEEILGTSIGLTLAETMSRVALGDSMITANIAALSAGKQIVQWADSMASARSLTREFSAQFAAMRQVAELVEQQNRQLLRLRPRWEIAQPASLATRAFEDILRTATTNGTGALLSRVDAAGRTTGWTLDASTRLSVPAIDGDLEDATETALGPVGVSAELRVRLAAIDRELPTKLDGAWERIDNGGTDAGRQAAHSLMEALDWTLRLLAPEDDVLAWYAAQVPKPPNALDEKRRPTRSLKLRFTVRDNPEKAFAIDLYQRAIKGLVGSLQDPKHGIGTTDPRALAPVAMTVESFLLFVVGD
jgi:hypothetical protein